MNITVLTRILFMSMLFGHEDFRLITTFSVRQENVAVHVTHLTENQPDMLLADIGQPEGGKGT